MNKSAHRDFPKIGDRAEIKVTFSGQYDASTSNDGARIVNVESEPYEEPKYWLWIVAEKDARMPLISTPFDTPIRAFNEALFWANETHGVSIECECHESVVFSIPLGPREPWRRRNKRRASVFTAISSVFLYLRLRR